MGGLPGHTDMLKPQEATKVVAASCLGIDGGLISPCIIDRAICWCSAVESRVPTTSPDAHCPGPGEEPYPQKWLVTSPVRVSDCSRSDVWLVQGIFRYHGSLNCWRYTGLALLTLFYDSTQPGSKARACEGRSWRWKPLPANPLAVCFQGTRAPVVLRSGETEKGFCVAISGL